jgi:hypothetical protein
MNRYIYAPQPNQLDGIMRPINPLMGYTDQREGWTPSQGAWYMGQSPLYRSDLATPTVDLTPYPTQMPRLDGVGAVQDALSVLSVVDLLTRG